MNFLNENRRFDLQYGENNMWDIAALSDITEENGEISSIYMIDETLRVTNIAKKHEKFGAYEWVNYFENIGTEPTEILSDIWDAVFSFPIEKDPAPRRRAYRPNGDHEVILHAPRGSDLCVSEFYQNTEHLETEFASPYHLQKGRTYTYAPIGGRSSDGRAPFFHLRQKDRGVIFAIGWTGQWRMEITRTEDAVTWKTKIEDTHFRLFSGERIRTSSILIMPYEGSEAEAHNRFRRLIREEFCPLGHGDRPQFAPLCAQLWGGMPSDVMIRRIETLKEHHIPTEFIWIDAGWYGMYEKECIDEFEGDWGASTGDWRVNPHIHPNGLRDVAKAARDAGMKLLLWFEPERVVPTTPMANEHPEWFIPSAAGGHSLLNLGDPEAWQATFEMLCTHIETLGISCYRQDFNFFPLAFFRRHDAEDRRGMTEILHILGLYRLWDALMERFPALLIDNCASGGKRIDIETLKRSVPLWRSDRMCEANYPETVTQVQNTTYGLWMPVSGTSTGRDFDPYRIRSAYAGGMTLNYPYTAYTPFGEDETEMAQIRKYCEEYLRVRPYFSEDMYPLSKPSDMTDVWHAVQFDRPSQKDGIVQVFRRETSPYEKAVYELGGIQKEDIYTFTDADTGEMRAFSGDELSARGISISIPEKRTAKLYFYHHKPKT